MRIAQSVADCFNRGIAVRIAAEMCGERRADIAQAYRVLAEQREGRISPREIRHFVQRQTGCSRVTVDALDFPGASMDTTPTAARMRGKIGVAPDCLFFQVGSRSEPNRREWHAERKAA